MLAGCPVFNDGLSWLVCGFRAFCSGLLAFWVGRFGVGCVGGAAVVL
jgi:hypothetical protein